MEQIHKLYGKIQAVVSDLIKTSYDVNELNTFSSQLHTNYNEFQEAVKAIRPTVTDPDELEELDGLVTNAVKAFNLSDQGIKNRLEKLAAAIKTEAPKEELKPQPPTTVSTSTAIQTETEHPVEIPQTATPTDVRALQALLTQITGQFNQILAGEFPQPKPTQITVSVNNPEKEDSDESDEVLGAPSTSTRATKASKKGATPATTIPCPVLPVTNTLPQPTLPCPTIPIVPADPLPQPIAPPPAVQLPAAPQPAAPQPAAPCQAAPNPNAIQQPRVELKMNRFTLPTFDGDLTNWLPFKDQFIDLIHSNQGYTPITKFIQLRAHLKGSALEAIQGFKLSAASYEAAWYILQRRYNKPDQIIDEYLRKLTDLPPITTPTAQRLISMVNCTNQILRVLPTLGVDVSNWDAIIKYSLTSKLDRVTHKKWLDQVKLRQNVKLEELVEFLEVEASEILPMPVRAFQQYENRGRHQQRGRNQPAAILAAVAPEPAPINAGVRHENRCPQCKGPHALFSCHTFKKLKVKDRINKVRGYKVCWRCLNKHNEPSDCKFGMCPICTKDHNSLLCYTKEKQNNNQAAHVATIQEA